MGSCKTWGTLWGTLTKMQTIIFLKRLLEGNSANGRTDSMGNMLVMRVASCRSHCELRVDMRVANNFVV